MASEYEEWLTSWRRETWCNESEANVLEAYLKGLLIVSDAALKITAPERDRRLPIGSKVGRVWQLLLSCATNCSESHSVLIDLIRAIAYQPKPTDQKQVDWTDQRTSFGELWRDKYDSKISLPNHTFVLDLKNMVWTRTDMYQACNRIFWQNLLFHMARHLFQLLKSG